MIIAGTGHRPDKLGGYNEEVTKALIKLATEALTLLDDDQPVEEIISGMALGWDQAIAQAAINLEIPFIAAIPFLGQEKKWPESSQEIYRQLLAKAKTVTIVSPGGYASWKMEKRNEWMVDNCDEIAALWNGTAGGTANCISYAASKKKIIHNFWAMWA